VFSLALKKNEGIKKKGLKEGVPVPKSAVSKRFTDRTPAKFERNESLTEGGGKTRGRQNVGRKQSLGRVGKKGFGQQFHGGNR